MYEDSVVTVTRNVASPPGFHTGAAVAVADRATLHEAFETHGALLVTSLHRIADGPAPGPEAAGTLLGRSRPATTLSMLSPRERDVLALMAQGLGNVAIAEQLFITEGAVHKHIRNIFAKLGLAPGERVDRRVAAVLRFLDAA